MKTVDLTNEKTVGGYLNKLKIKNAELHEDFKYITFCCKALKNILDEIQSDRLTTELILQVNFFIMELNKCKTKCTDFINSIEEIKERVEYKF